MKYKIYVELKGNTGVTDGKQCEKIIKNGVMTFWLTTVWFV